MVSFFIFCLDGREHSSSFCWINGFLYKSRAIYFLYYWYSSFGSQWLLTLWIVFSCSLLSRGLQVFGYSPLTCCSAFILSLFSKWRDVEQKDYFFPNLVRLHISYGTFKKFFFKDTSAFLFKNLKSMLVILNMILHTDGWPFVLCIVPCTWYTNHCSLLLNVSGSSALGEADVKEESPFSERIK